MKVLCQVANLCRKCNFIIPSKQNGIRKHEAVAAPLSCFSFSFTTSTRIYPNSNRNSISTNTGTLQTITKQHSITDAQRDIQLHIKLFGCKWFANHISTTSSSMQMQATGNPFHDSDNDTKDHEQAQVNDGKAKRWSNWTGRNSWKSGLLFMGLSFGIFGGTLIYTWGAPECDQDGEIIKDAFTIRSAPIAYCLRAWYGVKDFFQMVRAPTSEKLLPDPLMLPYIQPPYTLVLELSGLLLKPEWDMKMGWRFKKRPGLDYFLQTCAQSGFEIVIFTIEAASVGYPLTVSMDPQNFIWYRLFKEDTRYTSGVHIKDLGCLNRNLNKVILVDVCKNSYQLHPRNGIAVRKWTGEDTDRELYDLASFLQTIATNKVEDIRSVVQYYGEFEDPMAKFRENQAAVLKNYEEMAKLASEEKQKAHITKSPFISKDLRRK